MAEFHLSGILQGHRGWVTTIATTRQNPDMILTGSRDKSIIVWKLKNNTSEYGVPYKALRGHGHYVQDIVISSDGQYALSASWDTTLRLWDLNTGETTRRFISHEKDVLGVTFSPDNRQIISAGRDRSIKLWNTLAECKCTEEGAHYDWISCVKFSPNPNNPIFISGSWDKTLKVWNIGTDSNSKVNSLNPEATLTGHTGCINAITISPDGTLCASGGKDRQAILWDLNESSRLYSLETDSIINDLVFSPKRYWLCAATDSDIQIFDLENRKKLATLSVGLGQTDMEGVVSSKTKTASVVSLAWSADGTQLFAGYNDGLVRVWSSPL